MIAYFSCKCLDAKDFREHTELSTIILWVWVSEALELDAVKKLCTFFLHFAALILEWRCLLFLLIIFTLGSVALRFYDT